MLSVMEHPSLETSYNSRQFPYLDLNQKNTKNMRFEMKHPNTELAYNCGRLRYLDFSWFNTSFLQWNIRIRKLPTFVGSFRNWILICKYQKPSLEKGNA